MQVDFAMHEARPRSYEAGFVEAGTMNECLDIGVVDCIAVNGITKSWMCRQRVRRLKAPLLLSCPPTDWACKVVSFGIRSDAQQAAATVFVEDHSQRLPNTSASFRFIAGRASRCKALARERSEHLR